MIRIPEHLLKNARRIPFTDDMIRAADAGMKKETRRPARFTASGKLAKCMYGNPGDLLLVTGCHVLLNEDGELSSSREDRHRALYRVDWEGTPAIPEEAWRPAMFMPKWSPTRLLRNIGTDVVGLRDITEEQAIDEGIRRYQIGVGGAATWLYYWNHGSTMRFETAVDAFTNLWDSIHEERGLLFAKNPPVWRIRFEKVDLKSLV